MQAGQLSDVTCICFLQVLSSPPCILERTPAANYSRWHPQRRSSAPTLCRSKVALFSLPSKPTLLPLLLSMLVKGVTPSTSFSLPNIAPIDFRRPPLHLELSQLKRIHALRTVSGEGDSASVSTSTVAALEDAYTDADLFETIRQIRGRELDDAVPW
jgi:hypothetical protein